VSNGPEARATREEEVAFLIIEAVLGVDIRLADAGGGNKTPDGAWVYPGANARPAIVEVTSPPDTKLMRTWAEAKRAGTSQSESGSAPARWNELAEVCMEILREPWALENIEKLTSHPAEERHLFLSAAATGSRTTSTGCPTPTKRTPLSMWPTWYSPTESRMSGSAAEHAEVKTPTSLRFGWRGSTRGPGGSVTWSRSMSELFQLPTRASSMTRSCLAGANRR
jgi:hypothetical protein